MTELETLAALAEIAQSTDSDVPSPCISVCRMDDISGLCWGCYRTLDEIVKWGASGDAEKRAMWRLITQRIASASASASASAPAPGANRLPTP